MVRPQARSTAVTTKPSTSRAKTSASPPAPQMAPLRASSGSAAQTGSSASNGIPSACPTIFCRNVCSPNLLRRFAALAVRSCKRPRISASSIFEFSLFTLFGGIMISLAGKAAVITGGSRGIGAAAVKLFAQAGADVIFTYNKAKDAAQTVQQEAGKHGTRVEAFKADVGKHADNKKLVDNAIARLGRLDIVVA